MTFSDLLAHSHTVSLSNVIFCTAMQPLTRIQRT